MSRRKSLLSICVQRTTSDGGINYVLSCVRANEIIMSNRNIDSLQKSSRDKLESLRHRTNLIISDHGATHINSQTDHVVIPVTYAKQSYYVQTYQNVHSDHCTI